MKYCEGKCRREFMKYEGSANGCKYHRSFTQDKKNGDLKVFEICLKVSKIEMFFRWIVISFFRDFVEMNEFRGGRASKTVQKNRELK